MVTNNYYYQTPHPWTSEWGSLRLRRRHPYEAASPALGLGYRCLWTKRFLLCAPLLRNPAAETPIVPQIWCFLRQNCPKGFLLRRSVFLFTDLDMALVTFSHGAAANRCCGSESWPNVPHPSLGLPQLKIHQRGVQWKQGVVICMMLYTSLWYNATPIHCTPLPLHPPVMNTHPHPWPGLPQRHGEYGPAAKLGIRKLRRGPEGRLAKGRLAKGRKHRGLKHNETYRTSIFCTIPLPKVPLIPSNNWESLTLEFWENHP